MEIRTASLADLHTLSAMEESIFNYDVISSRQMRYLLQSETAIVNKAILDDRPVGYSILLTKKNNRVLRIYSLGVLKEERQLGVGSLLLRHAEKNAAASGHERIHLELHGKNLPGIVFYLTAGYNIYGRRQNYYTDGSSALLLKKYISQDNR